MFPLLSFPFILSGFILSGSLGILLLLEMEFGKGSVGKVERLAGIFFSFFTLLFVSCFCSYYVCEVLSIGFGPEDFWVGILRGIVRGFS